MITVENLTKAFGPRVVVNDVSFTLDRGEVLAFLGPNGAGKSTTMRMVTGYLVPTSGGSRSAGTTCGRSRSRRSALSATYPRMRPATLT